MSNENNTPLFNTPLDTQCDILTDLWLNYREEKEVEYLFDYFDISFPLAFCHSQGLAQLEPEGISMVEDCWVGILKAFGHEQDTGFETLSSLTNDQYP